jgi:16S rRNA (cytosine967-C5)-methyltransferase
VKAFDRLQTVPWHALRGLEVQLVPALDQVLAGTAAERVLDRFLRNHRDASAEQRTAIAEAVFGIGLWRRRLRASNRAATTLELLRDLEHPRPEPADFADRHSLPDWLTTAIQTARPDDADALANALNLPGPIFLRANTLRTDRESLARSLVAEGVLTEPGRWAPDCLVVTSVRPNLYGLTAWNEGLFEVQDEGSQLLGALVGAAPGEDVIDLCAGAGGKTLQLAGQLRNQGRLHAVDADLARLERLRTRASRGSATCVLIHGRSLPPDLRAQRILIDAPCSELGALRRGPDLRWRIDPATFAAHAVTQRNLLETALRHLAPGGLLVYATCTFRREENEDVVLAFEAAHPELRRIRPTLAEGLVGSDDFLHTWPHLHGTDAFFGSVHRLG